MSRKTHMCLSIRGFLLSAKPREYKGLFTHDDGRPMSPDEAKQQLLDELSKGHEVIPFGECDNFDFKTGCRGHEVSNG